MAQAWGRSQKYLRRPRHLYALVFDNGCCYIGQSVDTKLRERQHRARQGGWHRPFRLVPLSVLEGTQDEAATHEVAWRYVAHRAGWVVYAKPPGIPIRRPRRLMTPAAYAAARAMRWPMGTRGGATVRRWLGWALVVALAWAVLAAWW